MPSCNAELFSLIQDSLDDILADNEITAVRQGAVNFIYEKLRCSYRSELKELKSKDKEEIAVYLDELCERNVISGYIAKKIKKLLKLDKEAAILELDETLLEKKIVSMCTEVCIKKQQFDCYRMNLSFISRDTVKAIAGYLRLTDDEKNELSKLAFYHPITGANRLAGKLNELISFWCKKHECGRLDFMEHALVSSKAMEVFTKENTSTTQKTLLKLIVGLELPTEKKAENGLYTAEEFLAVLDSAFVIHRDLCLLACLYNRVYDPYKIFTILNRFSGLAVSSPEYGRIIIRFENLYKSESDFKQL